MGVEEQTGLSQYCERRILLMEVNKNHTRLKKKLFFFYRLPGVLRGINVFGTFKFNFSSLTCPEHIFPCLVNWKICSPPLPHLFLSLKPQTLLSFYPKEMRPYGDVTQENR